MGRARVCRGPVVIRARIAGCVVMWALAIHVATLGPGVLHAAWRTACVFAVLGAAFAFGAWVELRERAISHDPARDGDWVT